MPHTVEGKVKNIPIILAFWLFFCCSQTAVLANNVEEPDFFSLFNEICLTVEDNFLGSVVLEQVFPPLKERYRKRLSRVSNKAEFSEFVNEMLSELKTSHTHYLTPADTNYFHLGAIFFRIPKIGKVFHGKPINYPSIGIITEKLGEKTFIACVLAGSPAEKGGLLRGDEILSADGKPFSPVTSLEASVENEVRFEVKRSADKPSQIIRVTPALVSPKKEMLEAEIASIRIFEKEGVKVGYIHIYSYAGDEYHNALIESISWGKLKEADALIVDIRYGLGGANPSYLNMFNKAVPIIRAMPRIGQRRIMDSQWRKPAVYLTNRGTTSGKEILAFGAKKYGLATVIGEKTAGAVAGGSLFPLSNGGMLYLAVEKAEIDGEVLEGIGVEPDILVPSTIQYSAGKDDQLKRSVEFLVKEVMTKQSGRKK
jgi:carboxyl-terminal processing protease